MIYDATMFRNEFDMLRMRIEECQGADVTHVTVESQDTHRAVPKPLHAGQVARGGLQPGVGAGAQPGGADLRLGPRPARALG